MDNTNQEKCLKGFMVDRNRWVLIQSRVIQADIILVLGYPKNIGKLQLERWAYKNYMK